MKNESVILQEPQRLLQGIEAAKNIKLQGNFDQIIICGMGGSALPGELLKLLIPNLNIKIPVHLNRGYSLPFQTSQNSLVIANSYSGNTEETISAYEEALKRNLTTIATATGGRLQEIALENKKIFVQIPNNPPVAPRFGLFTMFGALLQILANTGITDFQALNDLSAIAQSANPENEKQQGLELADFLQDKIPLLYASGRYKALTAIWKLKLNESAGVPCFTNYFSELNHNEIEGFSNKKLNKNFAVVIFKATDENKQINKRMELTKQLLEARNIPVKFANLNADNIWNLIMQNSLLGDWTAFALAEKYSIDPATSDVIEEFKKKLNSI